MQQNRLNFWFIVRDGERTTGRHSCPADKPVFLATIGVSKEGKQAEHSPLLARVSY